MMPPVTADLHKRKKKKGAEYGMPVSVLLPPEATWEYDAVTSTYNESPHESWERIVERVQQLYPVSDPSEIIKLNIRILT